MPVLSQERAPPVRGAVQVAAVLSVSKSLQFPWRSKDDFLEFPFVGKIKAITADAMTSIIPVKVIFLDSVFFINERFKLIY